VGDVRPDVDEEQFRWETDKYECTLIVDRSGIARIIEEKEGQEDGTAQGSMDSLFLTAEARAWLKEVL
jgi:hypothetical protein